VEINEVDKDITISLFKIVLFFLNDIILLYKQLKKRRFLMKIKKFIDSKLTTDKSKFKKLMKKMYVNGVVSKNGEETEYKMGNVKYVVLQRVPSIDKREFFINNELIGSVSQNFYDTKYQNLNSEKLAEALEIVNKEIKIKKSNRKKIKNN